jgi:hypothetical protein
MTIQPINITVASILFLLSLMFVGPLYIAVVSLTFTLYIIIAILDAENDLIKATVDTDNHTIMTRSRTRLRQKLNSQSSPSVPAAHD